MFERPLTFQHADGSKSAGRVDLYRRGAFVLESKKFRANTQTRGFDEAMLRAHSQAQNYARALPASEGRPPFLVVVDVGHRIELYSEFSRSGGAYVPFPDPRSHRITLDDLRKRTSRRLRSLTIRCADPAASAPDPRHAKQLARRKVAGTQVHSPRPCPVLMRCLFTMSPKPSPVPHAASATFVRHVNNPTPPGMFGRWSFPGSGGFSAVLALFAPSTVKLFKRPDPCRGSTHIITVIKPLTNGTREAGLFGPAGTRAHPNDAQLARITHRVPWKAGAPRDRTLRAEWAICEPLVGADADAEQQTEKCHMATRSPERLNHTHLTPQCILHLLGFPRVCAISACSTSCCSGIFWPCAVTLSA